jgi:hypothetical protein
MSLFHADSYDPDDMVMHPRHQAMQPVLVQLIQQLRDSETVKAGADFQRVLLTRLLEVEKDRWEFKRAATRMRKGKQPPPEAPEPQSGRDLSDIVTWRFEHDVCERLARQLRRSVTHWPGASSASTARSSSLCAATSRPARCTAKRVWQQNWSASRGPARRTAFSRSCTT